MMPEPAERPLVALAGNPNVGKSTVFNALTGLRQHTGNWPGKTVEAAFGISGGFTLADVPGTYSLAARSAEEEAAEELICFGGIDAACVVCDAGCLERNLFLALQVMEACPKVVVCVNLMDEARRKGVCVNLAKLSERLGAPVVGTAAREKKGLKELREEIERLLALPPARHFRPSYCESVERSLQHLAPLLARCCGEKTSPRWLALKMLESPDFAARAEKILGCAPGEEVLAAAEEERERLKGEGLFGEKLRESLSRSILDAAEKLCRGVITYEKKPRAALDRRLDRLFTGRLSAYPIMLLMLAFIFWLTVSGANYPSAALSRAFFWLQERLSALFAAANAPEWLHGLLVDGVYRVLAWVVAVMLPPMAIFFPLFTLLEDSGYLPRVAYNLDRPFRRCSACGKQALTMCMGLGCNAVGVTGCRIIDSPRERLLAVLTNSLVPCNGRFPTIIAVLSMFFAGSGAAGGIVSALLLTGVMALGAAATLAATAFLSKTFLKGLPSSFVIEMPPYRRPQFVRVIMRSLLDRTVFVLGRAAAVAAPAGAVIWIMANVDAGGASLLARCAGFLDPLGRLMGMDGVLLMAFILGFPANEIVLPIAIMAYMSSGTLQEAGSLMEIRAVLAANGWTELTALCVLLFSLMHWPCSTTLITVKKETGSLKWTALAFALPTAMGMAACILAAAAARLVSALM